MNQIIQALQAIDIREPSLWISVGTILFNPIYWNVVARNEYRHRTLTSVIGSKYVACGMFSVTVFVLGLIRDSLFLQAILNQPHGHEMLTSMQASALALLIFSVGSVLVASSMYTLGVYGTYLGDYFGILFSERITGFPFNVVAHPMYYGSSMCFLGTALWYGSPLGIILSAFVLAVYVVAGVGFEEKFTNDIYAKKSTKSSKAKNL
jgi:methylene-fatty-acyl-phospholipid synthase